ncbi:hypothetical protein C8F04DRAFT_1269669 [Mycena alexandri]|uniref:Uncharacterized protein n=1 Tax=Mycena alexandri TaxID=1745969 RepID=A0AAD6SGM1_9AGAR|nr:hypothetical protein C8F04DRAFT_1269669 [Mycena alexandri]
MGKYKSKDVPHKKRGNRSDVVGLRAEHLFAELDGYCVASNAGTTRKWYSKFFEGYWAAFPWEIPFEEDPTEEALARVTPDNALTEAQKASKNKILADTEGKIKRWFNYQRTHSGSGINPWSKWLRAELKPPEDERRPRRLLDYQVYMQDEEKNAAINAALKERYPDKVGAKDSIKWRAALARELLAAEPEEVQEEFKSRADEEYEEAKQEFQENEGKGANNDDFDENARAEARVRLVATVKPLLLSIRKLTGYQVSMLLGGVFDGKVEVRSVHGGTVDGENEDGPDGIDFTRWDPQGYKPVMKQFMRYIAAANGTPQTVEAASAPDTVPPPANTAGGAILPAMPEAAPPPSSHPPAMPPSAHSAPSLPSETPPPIPPRASSATPPPCSKLGDEMEVDAGASTPGRATTPAELEGLGIDSPLQRAVMQLTPGSRALRINRLGRMSDYERTREENMARNKEILASINVSDAVAELMKDVRRDMKRKPEEQGGEATKRPRVAGDDGADADDYSGSGSDNDDEEDGGTPKPKVKRGGRARAGVKAKGGRSGGGAQMAIGADNVPKWATSAHGVLLAGGGGETWLKTVDLWWVYEKRARFVGPAKGKGTALRPKEVSGWIARARSGGPVPAIADVYSFASKWWAWWVEINPKWRTRTDGVGVPTRLRKEGEGDWDSVASTGPNGMLNILMCLRWWYDALKGDEGGMAGWKEAVEDVNWALERICVPAREEETQA